MIDEKKVEGVRIGGGEPVDVVIREILLEDDEYAQKNSMIEKITGKGKQKVFDFIKFKKIRILRSMTPEYTIEQLSKTPTKDFTRISKAFNDLNELSEDKKSGSEA